jgi:hypothetical protein
MGSQNRCSPPPPRVTKHVVVMVTSPGHQRRAMASTGSVTFREGPGNHAVSRQRGPAGEHGYSRGMAPLFHVSSVLNRESILAHGLDWDLMGAAPGIAGSTRPEERAVFLCRDAFEAQFFVNLNNTGGPVDVWEVTGIEEGELVTGGTGFCYFPARIPPAQVALASSPHDGPTTAASPKRPNKKQPKKKKPRAGK